MLKVALSHDIDRTHKSYQYFTKPILHLLQRNNNGFIGQLKSIKIKNPYWTFEQIIEIESFFGVRSTFFFLNESIKFDPFFLKSYKLSLGRYNILDPEIISIIKKLDTNGWEIGVHGSYNSFKDLKLLLDEKKVLEKIVGHSIAGVRQHYLNLDKNTWEKQNRIGFKYDASWGYTDNIGFKDDVYLPFYPMVNNNFKVIPLCLMDTCFMKIPDKWNKYDKLLDFCEQKGAVMTINFHQHVFSVHDFPNFKECYVELIRRAIKRNARFCTHSEI